MTTTVRAILFAACTISLVAFAANDRSAPLPSFTVADGCQLVLAKSGGYYVVPVSKYPSPLDIVLDHVPPVSATIAPALPPWRDDNPALARREFLDWIEKTPGREPEIVTYLSQHPPLRECFEAGDGGLRVHTFVVLATAAMQWDLFDLESVVVPPGFALKALLKATIALHDIGKGSPAYLSGFGITQHQATVPILKRTLATLGFSEAEIALAVALVNHDHIGLWLRDSQSVDESYRGLAALAATTVLKPRDFFRLQTFYYVVDAASYFHLRRKVFGLRSWDQWSEQENRRLTPINPLFQQLTDRFR